MKADVTTLEAANAGTVKLADAIFGLEPRPDLLHRMVRYQQLKRMAGTHHAQDRSGGQRHRQEDVQAEGHRQRPPRRQVGAAVARRRRGVRPKPRSHAIDLPKKVRALALRHALSAKARAGEIVVLDKASSSRARRAR